MKEWTMTMGTRSLSLQEIEAVHFALVMLRGHLAYGNISGDVELDTVRELIHEMTFGGKS